VGDRGELSTAYYGLLKSRGLSFPDARPLYSYRFARSDYDEVGSILRRFGPSAAFDRHGAALIVAYVAEWFRRERSGGHWDWIRPLRSTAQYVRRPGVDQSRKAASGFLQSLERLDFLSPPFAKTHEFAPG
jgi:hypothetical protein